MNEMSKFDPTGESERPTVIPPATPGLTPPAYQQPPGGEQTYLSAPGYAAPAATPGPQGPLTDRQDQNTAVVVIAWVVAVGTLGYMLPWAIAATRGKSNHGAIAVVNLLLGWTIIGWVIALVMACGSHQTVSHGGSNTTTVVIAQNFGGSPVQPITTGAAPNPAAPSGWYKDPAGPGQRFWDGSSWTEHHAP